VEEESRQRRSAQNIFKTEACNIWAYNRNGTWSRMLHRAINSLRLTKVIYISTVHDEQ